MGVIHHMRDQREAWSTLCSLLLDGGTMTVGVYSKVARLQIIHARRFIAESDIIPTNESMRIFRQDVISKPEFATLKKNDNEK